MAFKNYIFDIDGTLLNTYLVAYQAKEKVLKEYHLPFNKEMIDLGFSSTSEKSLELLGVDLTTPLGQEILKKESIYYNEFAKDIEVFDNALEVIKYLKDNQKNLAIVTSRTKDEVLTEPKLNDLLPYFDYIITVSDVKKPKPDKESLEVLFKMSNWKKDESIFIGDSNNDYKCAKSFGIKFGLAGWGAVDKVDYDYYLKKLDDLKKKLNRNE